MPGVVGCGGETGVAEDRAGAETAGVADGGGQGGPGGILPGVCQVEGGGADGFAPGNGADEREVRTLGSVSGGAGGTEVPGDMQEFLYGVRDDAVQ